MTFVEPGSPTPDRIMEIGHAFRASRALLSAVELGVFTALAEGPLELDGIRKRIGVHRRAARDFLDTLVALGLLVRTAEGRYSNSGDADCYLDRNKPTYVGGLLERFSIEQYGLWASLTAAIRTGMPQCNTTMVNNFAPIYDDEAARRLYVAAMTAKTQPVAGALTSKFPWREYNSLVDIGTSQGCLPVEIAKNHSHIIGGGFDLPPLSSMFESYVQDHGLQNRLRFFSGDFFKDPLPTADVLVIGRVLHNWNLATKKMLLKKAYDALPPNGVLIVYERLIDEERQVNADALLSSLQMLLASPGGFDFTGADCAGWMRETGFRDIRIEPLTANQSMIVGTK
jgi:SAM-dependent methyltransferase